MTNDKNDSLREALRRVFAAQRRYYHQNAQRIGLATGQGQGTILAQLRREDHLTQRELADRCNIDTTTMSRALDRLEENGLLCRRKTPESRRSYQIVLTDAGREKAEAVQSYLNRLDGVLNDGARGAQGVSLEETLCVLAERIDLLSRAQREEWNSQQDSAAR